MQKIFTLVQTMVEKTFFLSRHGCAKNQVDAELIVGTLSANGWQLIDNAKTAKVIIVNSCGFIESAKTESLQAVFEARKLNPKAKIILAGCLTERYASELAENLPEADYFFGNGDISKISEVLKVIQKANHNGQSEKRIWLYPQAGISSGTRSHSFSYPASTYIKITEGCSNHCSFCAIPLIRGNVRSRKINDIISEIKTFLDAGIYEFNLIGQDLAAFESNKSSSPAQSGLAKLLSEVSKLKGDFVIRLLYIHPDHFPFDILPIMQVDKRFLPYFDLPFQSASENILKAMNRYGNSQKYLSLIEKIKTTFKNTCYKTAYIRTTFLTGFPNETESDFQDTLNFLKTAKPLWSGTFDYSPEEDTKAILFPNPVPQNIALKRKNILQQVQFDITCKLLQNFIGKSFTLLVEEIIDNPNEHNFFVLGRTWFQAPEVDGCVVTLIDDQNLIKKIIPGQRIQVKIISTHNLDLEARLEMI